MLKGADLIPLTVWPYIYQLAGHRGGADMLYWLFCENIGYVLESHVFLPAELVVRSKNMHKLFCQPKSLLKF